MSTPQVHPHIDAGNGHRALSDPDARATRGPRRHGAGVDSRSDVERTTTARLEALAAYVQAWSLTDEALVRAELTRCWTTTSTHVSPFTDPVTGVDGLTRLILDFPAIFPGSAIRMTSDPDLHHDAARFAWRLDSTARIRVLGRDYGFSVEGLNYAEFDQADRIRRVVVFYGPFVSASAYAASLGRGPAGA